MSNSGFRYASGIALAVAMLASGAALAADPPVFEPVAPAPVPEPVFAERWTGLYAGVFAGYGSVVSDVDTTGTAGFTGLVAGGFVPGDLDPDGDGFFGGVTAGYNYQAGIAVIGIEGDIALTSIDGSDDFTGGAVLGTQLRTSSSVDYTYFGTLRARAGLALGERTLIFATGGLAFAGVDMDARVTGVQAPGLVWSGSESGTEFGWTVGGGAEVKVTEAVSVKLDGLYFDLSDTEVTATGNAAVRGIAALNGVDYQAESDNTGFVGRLGVNYHF